MIAKFSEAIYLLVRHLGLLVAIVLTVELPINILLNYVSNNVALDPSDAVRLSRNHGTRKSRKRGRARTTIPIGRRYLNNAFL